MVTGPTSCDGVLAPELHVSKIYSSSSSFPEFYYFLPSLPCSDLSKISDHLIQSAARIFIYISWFRPTKVTNSNLQFLWCFLLFCSWLRLISLILTYSVHCLLFSTLELQLFLTLWYCLLLSMTWGSFHLTSWPYKIKILWTYKNNGGMGFVFVAFPPSCFLFSHFILKQNTCPYLL